MGLSVFFINMKKWKVICSHETVRVRRKQVLANIGGGGGRWSLILLWWGLDYVGVSYGLDKSGSYPFAFIHWIWGTIVAGIMKGIGL